MSEKPLLSIAVTSYLFAKSANGRSLHTLADYRNYLRAFIKYTNDPPIDCIQPEGIQAFMNYMQYEHKVRRNGVATKANLSPKTVANIQSILINFWRWVAEEYKIPNPCKLKWKKAEEKPIDPLTESEVAALLKACDDPFSASRDGQTYTFVRNTRKRNRAIIYALLDTGARASELCDAKIKDLDIETGRLIVTGKGKKSRFVYLGRKGKNAVWAYLMERFPRGKFDPEEPLLTTESGTAPLNRDSLRHILQRLGKRAGVKNIHPHRFRHTFAVEYLRNGGDVFTLQQLLGHTTLNMVMRYVKLAQVDMERVHKRANPSDNWRIR